MGLNRELATFTKDTSIAKYSRFEINLNLIEGSYENIKNRNARGFTLGGSFGEKIKCKNASPYKPINKEFFRVIE